MTAENEKIMADRSEKLTENGSPASLLVRHHARKVLNFMMHFVIISMVLLLPEIVNSLSADVRPVPPAYYLKSLLWIVVFYVSFYLTVDPVSGCRHAKAKYLLQCSGILVSALAVPALIMFLDKRFGNMSLHGDFNPHLKHLNSDTLFIGQILRDSVMIILVMGLSLAIRLFGKLEEIEKEKIEYINKAREAELMQLRQQLNPHFLFNTLNAIYALVAMDPARAQKAIHRLSKLLRYMIYENNGKVTLAEDFQFLRAYIDLMRLRFPIGLPLTVEIDEGTCGEMAIAPLLFINVVENVFKYGARAATEVPMEISLKAKDGHVECMTLNANTSNEAQGAGTGIANLRRRLELRYPGRYKLEVESDKQFCFRLSLDLNDRKE